LFEEMLLMSLGVSPDGLTNLFEGPNATLEQDAAALSGEEVLNAS
jgi:hypothetical protein